MFDFGLRLRELREAHQLTQEDLAKKINKSKPVISNYENNLKIPPVDVLKDLAVLYNVTLDYLVGIEHDRTLVLDGLSEQQCTLLCTILLEMKDKRLGGFQGLTRRQLDILNHLLIEFTSPNR